MRSLLIKSSIVMSVVLALSSGVTMASAPSKPGMFLYPVKQITQKATGTLGNVTALEVPTTDARPQPAVTASGLAGDLTQEPTVSPHVDQATATATATPAPTTVQAVDEITATAESGDEITPTVEPGDNPDTDVGEVNSVTPTPDSHDQDMSDDASNPNHDQSDQNDDSHQSVVTPSSEVNDGHSNSNSGDDHQSSDNSGNSHSDSNHTQDNSGGGD